MSRKLAEYHCSGSDTLLGSANIAGSIVVLILLGYIGGIGTTLFFVWLGRRKREKYDLTYRSRYKDEKRGEFPDVDSLIKAATFPRCEGQIEAEEGTFQHVERSATSSETNPLGARKGEPKISMLPLIPDTSRIGPLQQGSNKCMMASLDGSATCLLRSQCSENASICDASTAVTKTMSVVDDPESPLPPHVLHTSRRNLFDEPPCASGDGEDSLIAAVKNHEIFSEITFKEEEALDKSANGIIGQAYSVKREKNGNGAPFQQAWEEKIENSMPLDNDAVLENGGQIDAPMQEILEHDTQPLHVERQEKVTTPHRINHAAMFASNPFATTEQAMEAVKSALEEVYKLNK